MSWSVTGRGKTPVIDKQVAADFAKINYLNGVEAELKEGAADLIAKALAAQPVGTQVGVSSSGHTSLAGLTTDSKTQTLFIRIDA